MRTELLNDRRHALTIDTADEVALWDIVRGQCLGVFEPQELHDASRRPSDAASSVSGTGSTGSDSSSSVDVLEFVKERIEGEAAVATWCKCDTRVGALTIHLEEARVFDAEVYADESDVGSASGLLPDHRIVLGKWVLRNLFDVRTLCFPPLFEAR
jgi:WD repeat-containing protein 48